MDFSKPDSTLGQSDKRVHARTPPSPWVFPPQSIQATGLKKKKWGGGGCDWFGLDFQRWKQASQDFPGVREEESQASLYTGVKRARKHGWRWVDGCINVVTSRSRASRCLVPELGFSCVHNTAHWAFIPMTIFHDYDQYARTRPVCWFWSALQLTPPSIHSATLS